MTYEREYDPVKRREYYLRTRKLKGRKKGQEDPPGTKRTAKGEPEKRPRTAGSTATRWRVRPTVGAPEVIYTKDELIAEREAITRKVKEIKTALTDLNSLLRKRLKEAKAKEREESSDERKRDVKRRAKSRDEDDEPTASEKSESARESKKYRERNQQKLKTKRSRESDTDSDTDSDTEKSSAKRKKKAATVSEIREEVANLKSKLTELSGRLRSLANAKPITKKP